MLELLIGFFSKPSFQIILFSMLVFSCDKEDFNLPNNGSLELSAINRPVCAGMIVQFRLYNQDSGEEIDLSDYSFELVPKGMGEITSSGLYKAPDFVPDNTSVEVKVKKKSNPKTEATHRLEIIPKSDSNLNNKVPHQVQFVNKFFDLSDSNEFLFGSPPSGTGPAKVLHFESKVIDTHGQTKWVNYLGVGQANIGLFYQDYSLVSGWLLGKDGASHGVTRVYDQNGNDFQKEIRDKVFFRDYYRAQSGDLFVSNSANPYYSNPTVITKISPNFEILGSYSIKYPIHSFVASQDESIVAFYKDEFTKKNGVVMVNKQGLEIWNIPMPEGFANSARLLVLNNQNFGLVISDCRVIPCEFKLMSYEIGTNGEMLNAGQTLAKSITLDHLINSTKDDQNEFHIYESPDYIAGVEVLGEEVLVVFNVMTKNYKGLMIKGTHGSSLEYWWDAELENKGQTPLRHISLVSKDDGLEWKTFCGNAICTFQLDKNLRFNPCF